MATSANLAQDHQLIGAFGDQLEVDGTGSHPREPAPARAVREGPWESRELVAIEWQFLARFNGAGLRNSGIAAAGTRRRLAKPFEPCTTPGIRACPQ